MNSAVPITSRGPVLPPPAPTRAMPKSVTNTRRPGPGEDRLGPGGRPGPVRRQPLDCAARGEARLAREVDLPHPAATEPALQHVPPTEGVLERARYRFPLARRLHRRASLPRAASEVQIGRAHV